MRKNTLILIMMAVVTLFFIPITQGKASNDTVTSQDVKAETKELIDTLQQYTADQRDEAMKEAEQAMDKIDARIDELESRVDNNWDKMTQAAREKARANLKALRQQRNELSEWYGSFKTSSASAWEEMKKGFSDAYQALAESWGKAKNEYDADNK
jgi:peptidoglycan hydrolase CwlO-like protein